MAISDIILPIIRTASLALAIGIFGYLLSTFGAQLIRAVLERFVSASVARFLGNLARVLGYLATGYLMIQQAGVTGILVIIATAVTGAFAIGSERIAADTIAGIKLFLVRYYKVGDWVTIGDYYGEIQDIHLTYTKLQTLERDNILIPNSDAVNTVITNHSLVEGHFLTARLPVAGKQNRRDVLKHLDTAARNYKPRVEALDPEIMLEDFGVSTSYYMVRVVVPDEAWDLPNEARLRLELADHVEANGYEVGEALPFLLRDS